MPLGSTHQFEKVSGILGHDGTLFANAARKHAMITLAAPTDMRRMDGIVTTGLVQPEREQRRQTLINEKLQAASARGAAGRPRRGCARA